MGKNGQNGVGRSERGLEGWGTPEGVIYRVHGDAIVQRKGGQERFQSCDIDCFGERKFEEKVLEARRVQP